MPPQHIVLPRMDVPSSDPSFPHNLCLPSPQLAADHQRNRKQQHPFPSIFPLAPLPTHTSPSAVLSSLVHHSYTNIYNLCERSKALDLHVTSNCTPRSMIAKLRMDNSNRPRHDFSRLKEKAWRGSPMVGFMERESGGRGSSVGCVVLNGGDGGLRPLDISSYQKAEFRSARYVVLWWRIGKVVVAVIFI